MIDTNALRGEIVKRGETQRSVARKIGISEGAFYSKMKRGVFNSDEMAAMVSVLNIENPMAIFFAPEVA